MRVQSPGGGNGNPYQCSCLENSRDRGAWLATVRGAAKNLHKNPVHTIPIPYQTEPEVQLLKGVLSGKEWQEG